MITIEAANRSIDILIGTFVLCGIGLIIFISIYIRHCENKAKLLFAEMLESEKTKLADNYKEEKRKIQAKHFVENYNAKQRILELENQLRDAEHELRISQSNYSRLAELTERAAKNGKR